MRVLLLAAMAVAPIMAQTATPFSCVSDAPEGSYRTARNEGKTELVADVVVTCTGGFSTAVGQPILPATFTLTFDAPVTSRILGSGGLSEALVLIDDPYPGSQYACPSASCTSTGNGGDGNYYGPTGNYNVFQGAVSGTNTLIFSNIPVDPPGQGGLTRTFRFTNIRLNSSAVTAATLNLTGIAVSGQLPFTSIPGARQLAARSTAIAGSVGNANNSTAAPAGVPVTLGTTPQSTATRVATLRYAMQFSGAAAPRTWAGAASPDAPAPPVDQNYPGYFPVSESGFYNSSFPTTATGGNLGIAGLADWGTRLMATFTNIPEGVTVYVSLRNDSSGNTSFNAPMARLTASDAAGAGAFSAVAGDGTIARLTAVSGSATAVWEVLGTGGFFAASARAAAPRRVTPRLVAGDTYTFGVWLSYNGGIYPAPPTMNVRMYVGPTAGGIPVFTGIGTTAPLATFTATTPPPPPAPTFGVAPSSLAFAGTVGGNNPAAQTLSIASSPTGLAYAVGGGGTIPITATPASGATPASVSIGVNTRGLAAGTYRDAITVSGPGGSMQVPVTLTLAPAPTVLGISPSSTVAGSPAFTLTVSGTNFTAGSTVTWNGAGLATSFGSSTSLTAQVPAELVSKPGTAAVGVTTADAARSGTATFTILPFQLTGIDPATVVAGGPAFTLTASGVGFLPGATLSLGQTTSSTSGTVVATVPASAIANPGTISVTVTNPGGLTSNALTLTVLPPLKLTAIAPAVVTATHPAFTLSLTGTGFPANASAAVGSATLSASGGSTSLSTTVPASAVAEPGTLPVRVVSGAISSNSLDLTVRPAPRISSVSPSAVAAGAGVALTVTGTGLFSDATVQWNGQGLATSGAGPTQLTAQVPASLLTATGTGSVTVVSFDGVVSNTATVTITPAATITAISPTQANVNSGAFTLTVSGTNLQQGSVVNFNGQALATTFVSASTLTAQVPANLIATVATANVTVTSATGSLPFKIVLPQLTNVGFTAPPSASSGQDQSLTLTLGGTYPVDLRVTLTLTFTPDSGLPDDPAIQFQNGSRTFTFTVPAGTPATIPQLLLKTGTVAGVITITPSFTAVAGGTDVTPTGVGPQRIQVGRAVPVISSVTCSRSATGFTVVIDGYTNTREATQATFDFTAASGQSLGTSQVQVNTASLFGGWFGSSAAAAVGGVFRYTQPFNVNGAATSVASIAVKLGNAAGTSATASCQLQ